MSATDLEQRYPLPPPETPPAARRPKSKQKSTAPTGKRLVSLDAYRGFIMTMLAASGFGIAKFAGLDRDNSVWQSWDYDRFQQLSFHFEHPAWESVRGWIGVSFWDLIQPAFMFMVGVAMPFSYARRQTMGSSARGRLLHALWRAVVLVLLGVFLYSLRSEQTNWIFTNVLAQIGLGYFFAYLLLSVSPQLQLGAIAVILMGYWGWFMMNPPPETFDYSVVNASVEAGEVYQGRFAPWSKNANAAHFFDVLFLNKLRLPPQNTPASADDSQVSEAVTPSSDEVKKTEEVEVTEQPEPGHIRKWWFSAKEPHTFNSGGYTTLNFIPSIATTLLGILCGQLLMSTDSNGRKLLTMVVMGAACLGLGVLAHHSVCPIVKRIWTPSWVLFSGGYTIWMLAAFFLVFDILPLRRLAFPLVVVGMNSIAMYMMGQLLRPWVTDNIVMTHFAGVLQSMFGSDAVHPDGLGALVLPAATFAVFWLVAFWMYRNRYLVRI